MREAGQLDSGAGSSLAALRRRGLVEVRDGIKQTFLGDLPTVEVRLTTAGRAVARAGLDEAPTRRTPPGLLSEWLWGALAKLYRALARRPGGAFSRSSRSPTSAGAATVTNPTTGRWSALPPPAATTSATTWATTSACTRTSPSITFSPGRPTLDVGSAPMADEPLVGEILAVGATPGAVPADGTEVPRSGPADVDELVRRWLVEYRSRHTRDAYRRDINEWQAFLAASGLHPLGPLTRTHVAAWLTAQAEHGRFKPATRARRLAAVSAFYGWLLAEGYVARNPTARLERAHRPQWPKTSSLPSLTREQAGRLLAAADAYTGASGSRAAVIVALLLYGGLRVSELTGATVDQLGHSRGHRVLRVHGKGDTDREVVLPAPVTRRKTSRYKPREAGVVVKDLAISRQLVDLGRASAFACAEAR
jgi:hypothetical protein